MSAQLYTLRASPGRGEGLFATRNITSGTTILQDTKTMQLQRPRSSQFTDQQVQEAFSKLLELDQKKFLKLHEGSRAFATKLLRIYKANAFGAKTDGGYILLEVSKLNHSCVPNAELGGTEKCEIEVTAVIAVRDIRRGKDIFICMSALQ